MSRTTFFYNYWDLWELQHKCTFDGPNKLILLTPGITAYDVKEDFYSDWKEWFLGWDGVIQSMYEQAFRTVGGDELPRSRQLDTIFFLINNWRIKLPQGNNAIYINGNLYTEEGDSAFISADGLLNNNKVELAVSSMISATTQQMSVSEDDMASIAAKVWGELLTNYNTTGTAGKVLKDTLTEVNDMRSEVKRILGLVHENFYIDLPTFDSNNNMTSARIRTYSDANMTSARIRTYSDAASVGTDNNVIAIYLIEANPSGPGKFTTWKQYRYN